MENAARYFIAKQKPMSMHANLKRMLIMKLELDLTGDQTEKLVADILKKYLADVQQDVNHFNDQHILTGVETRNLKDFKKIRKALKQVIAYVSV